jgi:hypothetical protein
MREMVYWLKLFASNRQSWCLVNAQTSNSSFTSPPQRVDSNTTYSNEIHNMANGKYLIGQY